MGIFLSPTEHHTILTPILHKIGFGGPSSTQEPYLNATEPPHKHIPGPAYVLGALLFSRICFWALAQYKGVPFVEGLCRWDCGWYIQLASNGYDLLPHTNPRGDAANWAFFPLYPLVMAVLNFVSGMPHRLASIVVSNVAMFFAILISLKYLAQSRHKVAGHFWVWLCVMGPYSFYFSSGYSEALFWLLACAALLAWQNKQFITTGWLTAALCATRLFGLFWLLGYLVDLWHKRHSRPLGAHLRNPSLVLGLTLCPLGLALFAGYLYWHLGDALAFSHVQIAWDRSLGSSLVNWKNTLQQWNDFEFLWAKIPQSRYAHAYFNVFFLVGLLLAGNLIIQKRWLESSIAICVFMTAFLAGAMSLPRFLVGSLVFAFSFHDVIARYIHPKVQAPLLGALFLFNLWLLSNWYDVAFFLV